VYVCVRLLNVTLAAPLFTVSVKGCVVVPAVFVAVNVIA
jgi:hypothetical protein